MNILLISVVSVVIIVIACLVYRVFYVKRKSRHHAVQKLRAFEGLIRKLSAKESISKADINDLAENPSTRHALFGILDGFGRQELFPHEYFTLEKSAESFLVNWLEFPTELDATPDIIELFTKITVNENHHSIEYFVFKYKKAPPPSGLPKGWMLGVTGPFGPESKPYDIPQKVFSRFNELGTVSPTEEVRWVHANISRK